MKNTISPARILALTGFLMAPLSTVAPLAIAPLLTVSAIGMFASGGYAHLHRLAAARTFIVVLTALCVWITASAAWSIVPLHSFLEGLRFAAMCLGGLVLVATARALDTAERLLVWRWTLRGLLFALALLTLIVAVHRVAPPSTEAGIDNWLTRFSRFDRSATTVGLLLWTVCLGWVSQAQNTRLAAWISSFLALATFAVVLALASETAVLCILAGIGLIIAALVSSRFVAVFLGIFLVITVVALPMIVPDMATIDRIHVVAPWLKNSGIHRLAIWHFGADRIAERPILGWGLDASRALPGGDSLIEDPNLPELASHGGKWMPLHPHNAALQWRLELGLPGATLCTLAVLWLLRCVSAATLSRSAKAILLALIGAALVVALLSYGFWQAWWQASLWLFAALSLAVPVKAVPAPLREP